MKNKYAQKLQFKRQRNRLLLFCGIPLLITLILIMTITLMMINKSKYAEVSATVFINEEAADASEQVTLRYIISGEAYFQEFEKAPSKWDHDQLVRIEYMQEDPYVIRKIINVSPFVVALVILIVIDIVMGIKYYPEIRTLLGKNDDAEDKKISK